MSRSKLYLGLLGDIARGMAVYAAGMSAVLIGVACALDDIVLSGLMMIIAAVPCSLLAGYAAAKNPARSERTVALGLGALSFAVIGLAGGISCLWLGVAFLPSTVLGGMLRAWKRGRAGSRLMIGLSIASAVELAGLSASGVLVLPQLREQHSKTRVDFEEDEVAHVHARNKQPATLVRNADGSIERRAPKDGEDIVGLKFDLPPGHKSLAEGRGNTLVKNADGTIERREPKQGEGIVGLIGELPRRPQTAPSQAQLTARAEYRPPSIESLGPMQGDDSRLVRELAYWAGAMPKPEVFARTSEPSSRKQIAKWLKDAPSEASFNLAAPGAGNAVYGMVAEYALHAWMSLPPNPEHQQQLDDVRESAWNSAQLRYTLCARTESSLKTFCSQRLRLLEALY